METHMGKLVLALKDKIYRSVLSDDAYAKKLAAKNLTPDGESIVSSIPQAPPVGYKKQLSMVEIVREQVRTHLSQIAADNGHETFEESEDFDVEDDGPLPDTPWENEFDPPVSELREAVEASKAGGAGGAPPAESPPAASAAPAADPAKPS